MVNLGVENLQTLKDWWNSECLGGSPITQEFLLHSGKSSQNSVIATHLNSRGQRGVFSRGKGLPCPASSLIYPIFLLGNVMVKSPSFIVKSHRYWLIPHLYRWIPHCFMVKIMQHPHFWKGNLCWARWPPAPSPRSFAKWSSGTTRDERRDLQRIGISRDALIPREFSYSHWWFEETLKYKKKQQCLITM